MCWTSAAATSPTHAATPRRCSSKAVSKAVMRVVPLLQQLPPRTHAATLRRCSSSSKPVVTTLLHRSLAFNTLLHRSFALLLLARVWLCYCCTTQEFGFTSLLQKSLALLVYYTGVWGAGVSDRPGGEARALRQPPPPGTLEA